MSVDFAPYLPCCTRTAHPLLVACRPAGSTHLPPAAYPLLSAHAQDSCGGGNCYFGAHPVHLVGNQGVVAQSAPSLCVTAFLVFAPRAIIAFATRVAAALGTPLDALE